MLLVPVTQICHCGAVQIRYRGDWYCPHRRWWNAWRHDRSRDGWHTMHEITGLCGLTHSCIGFPFRPVARLLDLLGLIERKPFVR